MSRHINASLATQNIDNLYVPSMQYALMSAKPFMFVQNEMKLILGHMRYVLERKPNKSSSYSMGEILCTN